MSDSQHTSVMDFKANLAPFQQIKKKLDEAFGVSRFKQFSGAIKDTESKLKDLTKVQEELVEQMAKIEHGSDAYKAMAKQLGEVEKQARSAENAMERMRRAQEKGTGVGRGASFMGRAAGTAAGVAGGLPGAFSNLGWKAMGATGAMGLGAIGGALGAAGVPMMAAASHYGQYLSQQQAIAAANPYMARAGSRHAITSSADPGAIERARVARAGADALAVEYSDFAKTAPGPVSHMAGRSNRVGAPDYSGAISDARQKKAAQLQQNALRAESLAQKAEAMAKPTTSRSRAFDASALGSAGLGLGYNSTEAIGMAGQMAQAGGPVDTDTAGFGMALQRGWGVGMDTSGGVLRGARRTGGSGSKEELAGLFQEAMKKGLEGSEINDALQAQAGFMQDQARYGVKLDTRDLIGGESRLNNAGISGFQSGPMAQQIMGGVTGRFREGGGGSALDMMLMKQLGYTGTGGTEELAKFRNQMEDPAAAMNATMGLMGQFQGANISPELKARLARSALGKVGGGTIGINQAKSLMGFGGGGGILGAGARSPEDIAAFMAGTTAEAEGRTPGTLVGEAGITNQEIGAGGEMAQAVQNARTAMVNMASAFSGSLGPAITELTGGMKDLSGVIRKLLRSEGFMP